MINRKDYPYPVSKLISRGRIKTPALKPEAWVNYVAHYGFGEMEAPSLIGLALEERKFNKKQPNSFYAPIHAVRALGQLGDMAAEDYLVELLDRHEDDDLSENVIMALTMLSPRVPALLAHYFHRPSTLPESCSRAAEALYLFAKRRPDQRDPCVQMLTDALRGYQRQTALLNGFIIYYLIKLEATVAAEVIAQAFAAQQVEDDLTGSWASVQVALGLAKESDFTEDELLSAGDRALNQRRRAVKTQPTLSGPSKQRIETAGLSSSYSILEHLKR